MLRVHLLGGLEIELDGTSVQAPASQRPWALFACLALAGRPVARSELAARFWPDVLDQSARASLRSALWTLRRRLGEAVVVDGERVSLADAWVDVHEFDRLADMDPEQALALSRGELLEEFDDEWALLARQEHRERVIELLERLAVEADGRGEPSAALALTRRQLERDPLDEAVTRRLMTRLERAGDRAGAVRAYRALRERLQRELGVVPSVPTRELAARLQEDHEPGPSDAARSPVPGRSLSLVGRARELAALTQEWEHAAGTVAVVRGPAGLGKSRLAAELQANAVARGALVAAGGALDLGGAAPLSLWAEVIGELLPQAATPPPDASWPSDLALLGVELPERFAQRPAPAITPAPDLQRTRLFEAVVALIGFTARQAPVLLVLEDVHDADGPSLELAGYAARRLAGLPVMMLLTRRPLPHNAEVDQLEHALGARGLVACEIELDPLGDDAVARLARQVAQLPEEEVESVVRGAEGNPLLAVESARAIARGNRGVARSLRALVRAELAPLARPERELVELMAVAGRALGTEELGQEAAEVVDAVLETGVAIDTGSGVGFRHALLRDAVYEEMPSTRRAALHRRWADALLKGPRAAAVGRAAEIAHQLRLAGADAESVPHLARAASEARNVGAVAEAVAYVRQALSVADDAQLWLELGELEASRGDRRAADDAFARAGVLLADAPALARARALLRQARAFQGPICAPRVMFECTAAALELLEGCGEPCESERTQALAARVWAAAVADDVEEAERLLLELGSRPGADEDVRVYDVANSRAQLLMRQGRFREAYGPLIAAADAILRTDRPDMAYGCWVNAAGAATAAGEHDRALEFLDRGAAAVAGRGLQALEVDLLAARVFVLRRLGHLDEAETVAEAEQTLVAQLGHPDLIAMASHDSGMLALDRGDYEAAARLLEAALVPGAQISRPLTRLALVEALARAGDPDRAQAELREVVLEPVRPSDFPAALVPRMARAQGLVAQARGDQGDARKRFEEAIAGWSRLLPRAVVGESMTTALADLGRPVVGLIEPERELARAQADLDALAAAEGRLDAVIP